VALIRSGQISTIFRRKAGIRKRCPRRKNAKGKDDARMGTVQLKTRTRSRGAGSREKRVKNRKSPPFRNRTGKHWVPMALARGKARVRKRRGCGLKGRRNWLIFAPGLQLPRSKEKIVEKHFSSGNGLLGAQHPRDRGCCLSTARFGKESLSGGGPASGENKDTALEARAEPKAPISKARA